MPESSLARVSFVYGIFRPLFKPARLCEREIFSPLYIARDGNLRMVVYFILLLKLNELLLKKLTLSRRDKEGGDQFRQVPPRFRCPARGIGSLGTSFLAQT